MGREGIEGYSDKTGGRAVINAEDRLGGPIASESALSPGCSAEERSGSCRSGETCQGYRQRPARGEGKPPAQLGSKVSLAGSNGCAHSTPVLSAALGFSSETPWQACKSRFLKNCYPSSLSSCKLPMQSTERGTKRKNRKKKPFFFHLSLKTTCNIGKNRVG